MGMFEYVRCQVPLPDGFTGEMQTKDFDCALGTLLIRADGRLMIEDREWQEVPLEERPNHLFLAMGSLRAINKRWRDLDFHGEFRLYGSEGNGGAWHEYTARFTHGTLESIEIAPEETCLQVRVSARGRRTQHSTAPTSTYAALTPGGRLDEMLATLPEGRRSEMESRVAALIVKTAGGLGDSQV